MRASFIYTHKPGRKFHFMDYIIASMDDDCAKVPLAIHVARLQGTYTVLSGQRLLPVTFWDCVCFGASKSDSTMSM